MKTIVSKIRFSGILLFTVLAFLVQMMSFCQNKQTPGQNSPEKTKPSTSTQTVTIKSILSQYDASKLTAADAKAIHEKLREAGLHAGPETRDAIVAAGFNPDRLRELDPPKGQGDQEKTVHVSNEERLKNVQEKVIKPLGLTTAQAEVVTKAYAGFLSDVENLKKSQANPYGPLDKSKIEPLEQTRNEQIRKVLTSEQYTKFLELEKASRPPKPGGAGAEKH